MCNVCAHIAAKHSAPPPRHHPDLLKAIMWSITSYERQNVLEAKFLC